MARTERKKDCEGRPQKQAARGALYGHTRLGGCITLLGYFAGLGCSLAHAGDLIVAIADRAGRPVPEVAVTATGLSPRPAARAPPEPAVMDQRDLAFVP
jgi:hypothetical protein